MYTIKYINDHLTSGRRVDDFEFSPLFDQCH